MSGIYYLMFSTFPGRFRINNYSTLFACSVDFVDLFSKVYGFGPGVGGLAYLGLGMGFFLATVVGAKSADQLYKRVCKRGVSAIDSHSHSPISDG